jgi:cell division protease FtsH
MASEKPSPQKPNTSPNLQPSWNRWVIWLIIVLAFAIAWSYLQRGHHVKQFTYTAFKQEVQAGQVKRITIKGQNVHGLLKRSAKGQKPQPFTTTLPSISDPKLMQLLESHHVTINAKTTQPSIWVRVLVEIVPWLLLIGIFFYISKKMRERMGSGGGGIFGFAKSRAKRVKKLKSGVKLEDVAGCENAKRDVQEIIGFLKEPERYHQLGANLPKGVLLMGPPGIGKTMLAKAVAGESDVPFFSISGSEFVEMFVGVGASRVRDMFQQAKAASPAIIFIDEIDSIGRARGAGLGGGHDEREQTLNQILAEMDGFSPRETVIVMAATNRPDVLDQALLRPGRFDRKIPFDLPSRRARQAILEVHAQTITLAGPIDFDGLAGRTVGMSGADLANLVNEAAMLAARASKKKVDRTDFENAYNRIVLGARREDLIDADEKRIIAFHESGHTLIARVLKHTDPINQVTIIPRGRALGATQQTPERERYNLNRSYLDDRLCVMLGGRGAEKLVFGEVSTGAENDLQQATNLAQRMVSRWGMSETFGPSAFSVDDQGMMQQRHFSEHTAKLIDEETRRMINDAERTVDETLSRHHKQLEKLAEALLERETIEGDELDALFASPPEPRTRASS